MDWAFWLNGVLIAYISGLYLFQYIAGTHLRSASSLSERLCSLVRLNHAYILLYIRMKLATFLTGSSYYSSC